MPDLSLTAVKLMHDVTGAQHLHTARDDTNNLFRCAFASMCMSVYAFIILCMSLSECLFVSAFDQVVPVPQVVTLYDLLVTTSSPFYKYRLSEVMVMHNIPVIFLLV